MRLKPGWSAAEQVFSGGPQVRGRVLGSGPEAHIAAHSSSSSSGSSSSKQAADAAAGCSSRQWAARLAAPTGIPAVPGLIQLVDSMLHAASVGRIHKRLPQQLPHPLLPLLLGGGLVADGAGDVLGGGVGVCREHKPAGRALGGGGGCSELREQQAGTGFVGLEEEGGLRRDGQQGEAAWHGAPAAGSRLRVEAGGEHPGFVAIVWLCVHSELPGGLLVLLARVAAVAARGSGGSREASQVHCQQSAHRSRSSMVEGSNSVDVSRPAAGWMASAAAALPASHAHMV